MMDDADDAAAFTYERIHHTVCLWEPVNEEVRANVCVVANYLRLVLYSEQVIIDQKLKHVCRRPV